jgi:hypothetical protein
MLDLELDVVQELSGVLQVCDDFIPHHLLRNGMA